MLDSTDAVVPGARVTLINQATKDGRHTVSNGEGFFSFPGLVPGDYTVRVEATGFSNFEQTGIYILPGDKQYLSQVRLKVGAASESVTVEASAATITTVDSPEKSAVITSQDMKRLGTDGRNATELLKTLPGFAIRGANKVNNQAGYDPNVQTIANSATGNYGANGMAPQTGGMSISSDGAQIIDPGDMGASVATVNMDMVQEVKIQTSNFGAGTAKGPIVINAIGKSGSQATHGSAYLYTRDGGVSVFAEWWNASMTRFLRQGLQGNDASGKLDTYFLCRHIELRDTKAANLAGSQFLRRRFGRGAALPARLQHCSHCRKIALGRSACVGS